jgi:large subunit ribosomal protein L29
MKPQEIRELSADDLRGQARDLQDQLFRLRIQTAMGQSDAPHKARALKQDLARLKTILREKEQAGSGSGGVTPS